MIARILVFCSSYVPLFVIFAIRFPGTAFIWWSIAGLFAAFGILLLYLVLKRHEPGFYPIDIVEENAAAATYVASYILPFVTINEPTGRDILAYVVFFLMLGVLYTRSSLLGVNPLIYLTSLRIYNVKTTRGESYVLFSRRRPTSGEEISAARAFAGLLVSKGGPHV